MGSHGLFDDRTFSAGALLLVCRRAWRVSWEGRPLCFVVKWPMSTDCKRMLFSEMWWVVQPDYCSCEPFTDVCSLQSNFTRPMWLEEMAEIRLKASGIHRRNKLGSTCVSQVESSGVGGGVALVPGKADCVVAQQEVDSHRHAAPRRRRRKTRRLRYRHIRAERSSEASIMIRSYALVTGQAACGGVACRACVYHAPISLPTMSDQLAIAFLLGALDLRQTSRSRVCIDGVLQLSYHRHPCRLWREQTRKLVFLAGTRGGRDERSLHPRLHGTAKRPGGLTIIIVWRRFPAFPSCLSVQRRTLPCPSVCEQRHHHLSSLINFASSAH